MISGEGHGACFSSEAPGADLGKTACTRVFLLVQQLHNILIRAPVDSRLRKIWFLVRSLGELVFFTQSSIAAVSVAHFECVGESGQSRNTQVLNKKRDSNSPLPQTNRTLTHHSNFELTTAHSYTLVENSIQLQPPLKAGQSRKGVDRSVALARCRLGEPGQLCSRWLSCQQRSVPRHWSGLSFFNNRPKVQQTVPRPCQKLTTHWPSAKYCR